MIKRFLAIAGVACVTLAIAAAPAAAQTRTKITAYTALENEQLPVFKEVIEKAVPDVEIVWVRDSTGVIAARILAEKDNPRADIILALAATNLLQYEKLGMLEVYEPKGASALREGFRDTKPPYTWTGMDGYVATVCFNTSEAAKDKIAAPKSWMDLTKPEFKGKVVMPNPASSGTGYLMVAGWLQVMGEEKGWKFMDGLHENVAVYMHSGSAPCVQAAKGERMVGIGFDMRGAVEKTKGAPIDLILPSEGAGWEMEATAIVKGTKNLEAAKKVADWVASKSASELYSKYYALVAHPDVQNIPQNYPANIDKSMIKNDFNYMADNRDKILAEWTKRYDSKSAPK